MAEQNKDNQAAKTAQAAASGARSVVQAAKAAGKAATGNVIGAAVDLLKDENIRNAILAIIICFSLLISCTGMVVGASIIGAIEELVENWSMNWDKNWEEAGISSDGNALYLYSIGAAGTLFDTAWETLKGLFATDNTVNGEDRNNSDIEGGQGFAQKDYDTTIDSIIDEEALTGADGALMKRVNMIKSRVKQRGTQIKNMAVTRYSFDTIGLTIGEILTNYMTSPVLFAGVDLDACSINVDLSAFETSDLQALKILALYSIQHDVDLTAIGMWDIMDYCGWYHPVFSNSPLPNKSDTIYSQTQKATYGTDIGNAVSSGDTVSYTFGKLYVPTWNGTCAPQWYYEELAQINKHNDAALSGNGMLWGITAEGEDVDLDAFENLRNDTTFGIIDQLFISTDSELVVNRTEYTGASEWPREAIAKLGQTISNAWDALLGGKSQKTAYGNDIVMDEDGKNSFTATGGALGKTHKDAFESDGYGEWSYHYRYYLAEDAPDNFIGRFKTVRTEGESLTWTDLKPNTNYYLVEYKRSCYDYEVDEDVWETMEDEVTYTIIDTFNTFPPQEDAQAYQIYFTVNVGFQARTVDDLALNILGLWPGNLLNVTLGDDGAQYAAGFAGFENLKKTWTDTYTAPDGTVHTLTFTRMAASQYEAYKDLVEALAALLNVEYNETPYTTKSNYDTGANGNEENRLRN